MKSKHNDKQEGFMDKKFILTGLGYAIRKAEDVDEDWNG